MSRGKVIIFTRSGAIAAVIAALATAGISSDAVVVTDDPQALQDPAPQSSEDLLLQAAELFELTCRDNFVDGWYIFDIEPEERHDSRD